jgi:hypothetical protein
MGLVFIFLLGYVVGSITVLPLLALIAYYWFLQTESEPEAINRKQDQEEKTANAQEKQVEERVQKGWIRLSNQYQPKMPEAAKKLMSGNTSFVNQGMSRPKAMFFAVLDGENLVCYDSERQQHTVMTLNVKEYNVSIYPKLQTENELYGRATTLRLVPALLIKEEEAYGQNVVSCTLSDQDITCSPTRVLYLNCCRRTDKEDWYFGLLKAQHSIADPIKSAQYTMVDNTHFSPISMFRLITQVQSSQSHRDAAWLNAVMGRIFLAMYKTDRLKEILVNKLRIKLDKTKRPTFLDEILIRSVDIGESVPFITDPKLISLTQQGQVIVEANVDYRGGLTIEIETNLNWSYSSKMKPIRMNLILAAKLRKLNGRLMFKLKAPPSNRYWLAFFEMPDMEWKITPIVADKHIKWSLVTNAIESKIREIFLETYVLPNMDDTAFCKSDGDGGIFGEYVMKSKESMHSRSSSTSTTGTLGSFASSKQLHDYNDIYITEPPSVPEIRGLPSASEALKLRSRRTQSDSGINDTDSAKTLLSDPTSSFPTMHRLSADLFGDHSPSHWSSTRLRRRRSHEDTKKVDTSLDIPSRTKKKGLRNRAGRYISKRRASKPDYTPLDDEKREQYAERLEQMHQRALDSKLADANSLDSFVKPGISANVPSPPSYETLNTKLVPPPLPTTPRPRFLKTIVK